MIKAGDPTAVQEFVAGDAAMATYLLPFATLPVANSHAITAVLLEHGADPNARGAGGDSALHNTATFNDPKNARLLLEHGAAVDIAGGFHFNQGTPLSYAAGFGYRRTAELFLEHGAQVYNAMIAACSGPLPLLQEYILPDGSLRPDADAGGPGTEDPAAAAARTKDPSRFFGWWCHLACLHNRVEIVRFFLEGYDVDLKGVHRIEYCGDEWAHIEPQNETREVLGTPLRHALLRGYDELAELLRQHGAEDGP